MEPFDEVRAPKAQAADKPRCFGMISALGYRQVKAVWRKNWAVKKRSPTQLFCELLTPAMLLGLLVVGWSFSEFDQFALEMPGCDLVLDFSADALGSAQKFAGAEAERGRCRRVAGPSVTTGTFRTCDANATGVLH